MSAPEPAEACHCHCHPGCSRVENLLQWVRAPEPSAEDWRRIAEAVPQIEAWIAARSVTMAATGTDLDLSLFLSPASDSAPEVQV